MTKTYIKVTAKPALVLAMLMLSQQLSGTLPTPVEFKRSLRDMRVEITPDFKRTIAQQFPELVPALN
ncbi:hypothetical protein ACUIJQ_00765 [Levilactobacillus hammesii]|uniref:Uncharacterized protein n=1 Tax=Levilactobacillus hammesii DSM 16381 TaxID=1423753 RepID=A0A0R1UME4_9LACO|nr:hypothetical protein [Levilactobacillus hammesii]KRL94348.1 hypothetical protein FD28_GL000496 [Levilactobacillus hammesii DSM 16381]